jgi:hypothetical protein
MKVTSTGVSQTSLTPAQQAAGASPAARDAQPEGATQSNDGYTPSAEWLRLVDLVKQTPDVRDNRVREVAQRLQNGDYLSPEGAARTADAMLHSLD